MITKIFIIMVAHTMAMLDKSSLLSQHRVLQNTSDSINMTKSNQSANSTTAITANSTEKSTANSSASNSSSVTPNESSNSESNDKDIVDIKIGEDFQKFESIRFEDINEFQLKPVKFFKFKIDHIFAGQDLFIIMKAISDHSSLPTLAISTVNHHPSSFNEKNSTLCGSGGLGVCSIAPELIVKDQTYYMGVYCRQTCDYGIKVSYQMEGILKLGEQTIMHFDDTSSRLLKLHVPATMRNIDRILIRIHILHESQLNEAFFLYVNKGNENPSPSKYDFIGEEIWMTGKGVVIHNNSQNMITPDHNYTMVIVAPAKTIVFIKSEFYEALTQVFISQIVDDIVGPGEINTYKLSVGLYYKFLLKDKDLSIDMHPYEGNPDLYISVPPIPDDLEDYEWQSKLDVGYESILLSPESRLNQSGDDVEYYLSVKGSNEMTSYSFIFYISDQYNRILSKLATETGFVSQNEIVHYNILLEEERSQVFTIEATFPEGQAMLIFKKCMLRPEQEHISYIEKIVDTLTADSNDFYKCNILPNDVEKYKNMTISQESDKFINITNTTASMMISGGTLHFKYDENECTKNAPVVDLPYASQLKTRCRFVIAIVSDHKDSTQYVLSLKGVDTHVKLSVGTPTQSHLMQKDKDFYVFKLKHDMENVTSIKFQFTVLNGDIMVWGSQFDKFPNTSYHTEFAMYNLDVIQFNKNGTNSMVGQYYLTVQAQSFTTYTVTVILEQEMAIIASDSSKASTAIEPAYIVLSEGVPQEISVNNINQIQHFSFKLHQTDNFTQLYINIDGIVGKATAYIMAFKNGKNKGHKNPSQESHQWNLSTSQRSLIIEPSDKNFVSKGEYLIVVYPGNDQVVYEIQYSDKWSITPLRFNVPHYDSLSLNQMKNYEIHLMNTLQGLEITRTITTYDIDSKDDIQLYISLSNRYPSNATNDFSLRGQNAKTLELNFTDLNKAGCHSNESCTLYFAARSFGGHNDFTILVRGTHEPTQLLEGVSQVMSTPVKGPNELIYFYYKIPKNKTVRVQTYSIYQELNILANIIPYTEVLTHINEMKHKDSQQAEQYKQVEKQFEALFPNDPNHLLKSEDNKMYGSDILIAHSEQLNLTCQETQYGCVMLITVQPDKLSYMYNRTQDYTDASFEIEASSDIEILRIGELTTGFTQGGIMEFYKLIVMKPVGMIQIAVSPLDDGDPDIYVKYQESNYKQDHFPNTHQNDFHSMSFKSDILLIQKTDKFFLNHSIEGTYIIGVLGFAKTKFSIEVTLADVQLYTIVGGAMMDKIQIQGANATEGQYSNYVFFKYNHVYDSNFRVVVQKSTHGKVSVGVNRHGNSSYWQSQSTSVFTSLPYYNGSKPEWSTKFRDRMFGGIVRINKNDPNYCFICTYTMGIKNSDIDGTEISIVIGVDNKNIKLQSGKTLYDSANTGGNYYTFTANHGKAEVQVKVYHGFARVYISDIYGDIPNKYLSIAELDNSVGTIQLSNMRPNTLLYMLVLPDKKLTNYSISAFQTDDPQRQIELGKSEDGQLLPNGVQTFFYFSKGQMIPFNLFVQFSTIKNNSTKSHKTSPPKISIHFAPNNNKTDFSLQNSTEVLTRDSFIQSSYILSQANGYYLVSITNTDTNPMDYHLVLNSFDMNFMLPNQGLLFKSVVGGIPSKFQLYIRDTEKLYLEVFQCLGDFKLKFENMTAKSEFANQQVFTLPNQVESGDLFFELEAKLGLRHIEQNHDVKEALMYIVPHILPKSSKLPSEVYYSGLDGILKVGISDQDIIIQFNSLGCKLGECALQLDTYPNLIIYTVHLTNNVNYLKAFSSCNLLIDNVKQYQLDDNSNSAIFHQKYFKLFKNNQQNLTEKSISMSIDSSELNLDQVYHLNILASVYFNDSNSEPFIFEYKPIQFAVQGLPVIKQVAKNDEESFITVADVKESKNEEHFYSSKHKIFGFDLPLVVAGGVIAFIMLIVLLRWVWLKFRKTKLKQANTRVRYDEEEQEKE